MRVQHFFSGESKEEQEFINDLILVHRAARSRYASFILLLGFSGCRLQQKKVRALTGLPDTHTANHFQELMRAGLIKNVPSGIKDKRQKIFEIDYSGKGFQTILLENFQIRETFVGVSIVAVKKDIALLFNRPGVQKCLREAYKLSMGIIAKPQAFISVYEKETYTESDRAKAKKLLDKIDEGAMIWVLEGPVSEIGGTLIPNSAREFALQIKSLKKKEMGQLAAILQSLYNLSVYVWRPSKTGERFQEFMKIMSPEEISEPPPAPPSTAVRSP